MAKKIRLLSRKAAPCGSATVEGAWRRLERWFQEHWPEALTKMPLGATAGQIHAFEEAIGRTLPEEVRQSFRIHNGLPGGVVSSMDFYDLEGALREWSFWQRMLETDEAVQEIDADLQEGSNSFPVGAIRSGYVNPAWVPLLPEPGNNLIGVDLGPGPEGLPGQVITFGRDRDRKVVLAWSWGWFLTDIAEELEQGNVLVEGDMLTLRDPPGRHFGAAVEDWSKAKTGGRRPEVDWTIDLAWLAWNDGTVARLAQSIAEERAFDRLPVLGDALQEAGCDREDILEHCRGSVTHGIGCWLIDRLLGKP